MPRMIGNHAAGSLMIRSELRERNMQMTATASKPGSGLRTLPEAKSIARHLGLTLRKVRSGDYRVNFRDGNETTAYYTDNLEDAVNAAVEMARKRASVVTNVCPNCGQSPC